ncbi:MAG: MarR family transcriptional regulator [Actinobacteria bacterium]|nr:MarR family transcriptional regulator [Actinomycetota bacterium]MBV8479983.1 MarR family transcriptional regulator [Actinomycetota bacterium]
MQTATVAADLRIVLGQLVRRLRNEYSFSVTAAAVLSQLDREGAQTTSELAHMAHVRPQSMAQTVSELEADGLVSRRPDPADGRRVLIEITAEGRTRLREERRKRESWLAEGIRQLSADEQQTLVEALPILQHLSER